MKLHLPKMLAAALIAAFTTVGFTLPQAQAGTTYNDVTYSGYIYNVMNTGNNYFHNAKFTNYYWNGEAWVNSQQWAGDGSTYYTGTESHSLTGKDNSFWRRNFGDASNGDAKLLGNTIRLASATGNTYYESTFGPYQIGGIIAEAGNNGMYVLGRTGGSCEMRLKAQEGSDFNMYVASNLGLSSNTSITVYNNGTWNVLAGKTLTLAKYTSTSNFGSIANTPSITFAEGVAVTMTGGGTIDMTRTDALNINSGATINVGANTTVLFASATTLGGTITNAGTVTFTGAVKLTDNLAGFESSGSYVNYNDETADDGYAGALTYTLVKGGTYTLPEQVTWNSQNLTVTEGKVTIGGDVDKSIYHLNVAGHSLDLANEVANNNLLNKVVMATGTTLTANASFAGTVEGVGTAKVEIAAEKVLTGTVTGVALTGSGSYVLADRTDTLGSGVTFAPGWTGTVKLSNIETAELDLNKYGITGSVVEIDNWAKHLKNSNGYVYNPKLRLTGQGLTVKDGYSNFSYVFAGGVEGTGDFKIGITTNANNQTYAFTGDVSQWTGAYVSQKNKTTTIQFYGSAEEMGAAITQTDGIINIEVGDGENAFSTEFDKAVTASKLTINNKATATFKDETSIGTLAGTGSLVVNAANHTVALGGGAIANTIDLQAGTLSLTGTYNLDGLVSEDYGYVFIGGGDIAEDNGFRKAAGTVQVATIQPGAVLSVNDAAFSYRNSAITVNEATGTGSVVSTVDYTTFFVNSGTDKFSAAWEVAQDLTEPQEVTSVVLANETTIDMDKEGGVSTALTLDGTGTVVAKVDTTITALTGTGTLNFIGDSVVTLASASTMTNAINIGAEDGSSTVKVKVNNGQALGAAANAITVYAGATLDINGKDAPAGSLYTITLAGGTLANTGTGVSYGSRQLSNHLIVSEDSTVDAAAADFGIINANYDPTTIELNANLEKIGSHDFHICNATFSGDGKLIITDGTLTIDRADSKHYASTFANDIDMNGGKLGGYFKLADAITITATDEGSIINALITNAGYTITFDGADDLAVAGVISGAGGIVKDGEGTLTLNGTQTYTGTTVVKGGKLVVTGAIDSSKITVEGDAVISGSGIDTTQVGIATGATAEFTADVTGTHYAFSSAEGETVAVTNNGETPAAYTGNNRDLTVVADTLEAPDAWEEVTISNIVQVKNVVAGDAAILTLDNVDGTLDLQNLEIGSMAFVQVYASEDHLSENEATVVISETLTAGLGSTLNADLTMKGGSTLDLDGSDGIAALTLGSTLTLDTADGLVNLGEDIISYLSNMQVGESVDLFTHGLGTILDYGEEYEGAYYDALFVRTDALAGDFTVYADGDHFGLTKYNNVPEPTTGTLSLLALAALAARRRKH